LIDVGPSTEGEPEFLVFENEVRKQFSIVIRGLRPRHILQNQKDLESMELYFDILRSGPSKPKDGSNDVSESGDLYGPDVENLMQVTDDLTSTLLVRGGKALNRLRTLRAIGPDVQAVKDAMDNYVKSSKKGHPASREVHALYCAVCDMEELVASIGGSNPKRKRTASALQPSL
jgi:hypothetical protein